MDPRFLEAWVNRADHRVFGRKLHPLCYLDLLALGAVNSPFLPGAEEERTATDYYVAVQILSRRIKSLEITDRIGRVGLVRCYLYSRYDLNEANAALQAYFDDYFTTLEMWRPEAGGGRCGAPWLLAQVTFLLMHTNLTERQIWTAPAGQMMCYGAAVEEQLSSSQVVSEEEREAMEEMRRARS